MSWFHKDKTSDYNRSKAEYCESLNDNLRVKLQNKIAQLEKENEELKKVSTVELEAENKRMTERIRQQVWS